MAILGSGMRLLDDHTNVHIVEFTLILLPHKLTYMYQKRHEHLVKIILCNTYITPGTVVYPTKSKVASMYGIPAIIISRCTVNHEEYTETCLVDKKTIFRIERVQSWDFFRLRCDEEQVCLGGLNQELRQLKLLMEFNIKTCLPQYHKTAGVLLHGPSGCGKTTLAKALAQFCKAAFLKFELTKIISSEPGAVSKAVRDIFKKAFSLVKEGLVILFFDELDKLCPSDSKASVGSELLTNTLVLEMDALRGNNLSNLLVVAATNAIANVNSSLRRPGRFGKEVLLNVPSLQQRQAILEAQERTLNLTLAEDVSKGDLALMTPGFVGADLKALCEEALNQAYCRLSQKENFQQSENTEILANPEIQKGDFMTAIHKVIPSLKKGIHCYVDLEGVQWENIGGLEDIKSEIKEAIEWPLLHRKALRRMDLQPTKGVLLYGPPGCCKTTLVRAAATTSHVTFLSLNGAQVYSPYVGESERIISEAFQKARALSPSVLFFDEIDSLVGKRGPGGGQSRVQERILATLLNEMDGIGTRLDRKTDASRQQSEGEKEVISGAEPDGVKEKACGISNSKQNEGPGDTRPSDIDRSRVIVIGATNRPDMLDPAILRPGRLDRHIFVPPPDKEERLAILEVIISKIPCRNVDLKHIAALTEGFSGADLKNLCREAALDAVRTLRYCEPWFPMHQFKVDHVFFERVLEEMKPSLPQSVLEQYSPKLRQL